MGLDKTRGELMRESEIGKLLDELRGAEWRRACYFCRYWQENRDDARSPRWGTCIRMSAQPPPGMMPLSEDPELGAMLITHPRHWCSEFEE